MSRILSPLFVAFVSIFTFSSQRTLADERIENDRYFLVNVSQSEVNGDIFDTIRALKSKQVRGGAQLGVASIISYLRYSPEQNLARLRRLLELAQKHELAVLVQLDGEQWWNARPELWNWWDPTRAGYDPANAANVDWSGWVSEHALKISWRNWGRQLRVLPPPNLLSSRYREACHRDAAIAGRNQAVARLAN